MSKLLKDEINNSKILEIGSGYGLTHNIMKSLGFEYQTLDVQEDNNPDILADIRTFKFSEYENFFTLVAAFQVLEHIKYEEAIKVLKRLTKVTNRYLFISLPYYNKRVEIKIKLFNIKARTKNKIVNKIICRLNQGIHIHRVIPYRNAPQRRYRKEFIKEFPHGVHYWEVGRGNITLKSFIQDVENIGYKLIRYFPNRYFPYHYFFLFEI